MTVALESNLSGAWETLGTFSPLQNITKFRFVDWLGRTYVAAGAFMRKITNGMDTEWVEAPKGKFVELHYEKLWIFALEGDPQALRHGDISSDTSFPVETDPTGNEGGLMYVGRNHAYFPTGMKSAFGHLFLWTEGDLWILFGADNSQYSLQRAHPGAGTLSHESIARFDTGMVWHDGLGNRILWWKGGEVYDITSLTVEPIIKAIPTDRKAWTAGFFDGRYYYFSYSRAGETQNDRCLVFDTLSGAWHGPFIGDWVGFNVGLLGVDAKRYVGSSNDNGVREAMTGETDNGNAIAFAWKSAAHDLGASRWTKLYRRGWVTCTNTAGTVQVKFYRNREVVPVRTYEVTFTGLPMETRSFGIHRDVQGQIIETELLESSTNPLIINEVGIDGTLIRALR